MFLFPGPFVRFCIRSDRARCIPSLFGVPLPMHPSAGRPSFVALDMFRLLPSLLPSFPPSLSVFFFLFLHHTATLPMGPRNLEHGLAVDARNCAMHGWIADNAGLAH